MQVNFETHNTKPAFTSFRYDAAAETMKKVLSSKQLAEAKRIKQSQLINNKVHAIFFGDGKKLTANIADCENLKAGKCTSHSQLFFESPMHFINRMYKKVKKRTPIVEELLKKQNFQI